MGAAIRKIIEIYHWSGVFILKLSLDIQCDSLVLVIFDILIGWICRVRKVGSFSVEICV